VTTSVSRAFVLLRSLTIKRTSVTRFLVVGSTRIALGSAFSTCSQKVFTVDSRGEGKVHFDVSLALKKWFTFGFTFLTFFTFFTFFIFFTFVSRRDHVRIGFFTFFTSKRPQIFFLPILNFEINTKNFFCCLLLF